MFRTVYRLPFTLLGIPLLLDITFLIVLPLFAFLLAHQIGPYAQRVGIQADPALFAGWTPYLLGLIAAIGLFVSVVIHELGHSIIARMYGVRVKSITLWLLGGMAQFEEMPRQRGAEAVVAIAGPITSFILVLVFWFIEGFIPVSQPATRIILSLLAEMNFVLAVFNLLPALPLDGGRVLRSLLALRMPQLQATQVAARVSKFLAVLLGLVGLLIQPWLILIAFFIYIAVTAETQQMLIVEMLEGIGVRDLMTRDVKTVPPDLTVAELSARMLREHHRGFPVADGRLMGIVTLNDLQGADPEARVEQIMSQDLKTVPESASALEAFQRMSQNNFGRLIVTGDEDEMVGIITKTDLMRAIQVRLAAAGVQPSGG